MIGEPDGARRVPLGCDELQLRSACVLKEPLALAKHERADEEIVLIDKAMLHERADKVATSQDRYGSTKLLFQSGHFFGDVALDQSGIVPGRLLQGG